MEELVLSQEDQPQTHRSTRQISREIGLAQFSVVRVIQRDLGLKCLKRHRAQELSTNCELPCKTQSLKTVRDGVKDTSVKAKADDFRKAKTKAKDLPVKAKYVKPMASSHEVRAKDIRRCSSVVERRFLTGELSLVCT